MNKIVILLCAVILQSCGIQSPDASSYMHTEGDKIVDGQGNEILLRTVGLGNWLLPEGYMWKFGKDGDRPRKIEKLVVEMVGEKESKEFWRRFRRNYITEADIARIKELGFNGVRPAMNWRLFMDEETGKFKKEGFQLIDNLVEWCDRHGVYIILDMHGAPGGQTGANIDDSANNFPELFSKPENQQRFIDLWVELAQRYRDEPIIIAYGLINEPLPKKFAQFNDQLEPLYKKTVAAIRTVDPYHIISLEGANWSTDFSIFGPPFDDKLIFQFHKYWSTPDTKSLRQYLDFRAQYNVPIYNGESGENNLSWYQAAYQLYEDHDIGWLFWPWKKMDTKNTPYSIKKPEGWDKIAAFSRGGEKPDPAEAKIILDQFIENIKLENCDYYEEVVNALFRRLPGLIEAENFTHRGEGISFHVINPHSRSKHYRPNEPVPINKLSGDRLGNNRRNNAAFAVRLQEGEWLHYEINSPKDQILKALVKVKSKTPKAALHLELDDKVLDLNTNFSPNTFVYGNSQPTTILRGQHDLKMVVDKGVVIVDWLQWK